jgi:hypothetical protein
MKRVRGDTEPLARLEGVEPPLAGLEAAVLAIRRQTYD